MSENIPELRFPEFTDQWIDVKLCEFLVPELREVDKPKKPYLALGIRSHFKGTFRKPNSDPTKIAMDKLFTVRSGDFILNITFAWEGALAIATDEDDGGLVSHRFPTYIFNQKVSFSDFFRQIYSTKRMKYNLGLASPGGAGRNRVLNKKDFLDINIKLPSLSEQEKIAHFLTTIDEKVGLIVKKIELLQQYKRGVVQKIFTQQVRFTDENGGNFPKWEGKVLSDIFEYEQPTRYIVESTEYRDEYTTPVLTAGKTFILGFTNETEGIYENLPVVIFDDFTTASHYVNFRFKVKSSAMKILKPRQNISARFAFELLSRIDYAPSDHKRHWIGQFQNFKIELPSYPEQQRITDLLTLIDDRIKSEKTKLASAKKFKKALLQRMFV